VTTGIAIQHSQLFFILLVATRITTVAIARITARTEKISWAPMPDYRMTESTLKSRSVGTGLSTDAPVTDEDVGAIGDRGGN
jgi:hypothetical protein